MARKQRVQIANRADGGVIYWLAKLYGFAFIVMIAALVLAGFFTYRYFAEQAPPAPDLARYAGEVPTVTRIHAGDGTLLGEFAAEWREVVPYDDIPEPLVHAFLAVEDHEFFEHRGIYPKGIARAAWANFVAGDFAQGGSTITQQVAKQFLGAEKSLTRKAKEAIVARRLEARYSKEAILSVYLNHIYLGSGAYGVKAAARRYFSKNLDQLDLAEMAVIAGLAKAPSYYSPLRDVARATTRRDLVLELMGRYGYIPAEEAAEWQKKPLVLHPYSDVFPDRIPYFAEHLRRYVIDQYGAKALLEGGLRVESTVQPVVSAAAVDSVEFGARKQDKRQGWRGPEWFVEGKAREIFVDRAEAMYGDASLEPGRRYLGLVENVASLGATVRVGKNVYDLPLANMKWAARWSSKEALNDIEIESAREALKVGDVIWVSREQLGRGKFRDWYLAEGVNPRWLGSQQPRARDLERPVELQLEQVPHPQAAIFTADHGTGYVVAMVGGHDFSRSEFNRAVQACRQPGSTYKPIYYSTALDQGYGFDTLLNDKPREEIDPVTGDVWTPTNLGGTVDNQVTLQYALVFSKNIPSVAIFKMVGADNVEKWARRLGFTTEIIADQALALGASCTLLHELTRAFAIFARDGRWLDWVFVRRIHDRSGNIVEDNTVSYDPVLTAADRLDRMQATAGVEARQAIPARTAHLTNKLLREVITHGFSTVVRQTGINAAGKTGTSSATMDTSFVAFTSRWITSVWLGDDLRERPLGTHDAAYMTVVPLWARYMVDVASEHPNLDIPWNTPGGVKSRDRGDHTKGEQGEPMPLVYRKATRPEDELQGAPEG